MQRPDLKLYCFSERSFNGYMKENGWDDCFVPADSAFISIAYPDEKNHWFKEEHDNVLNIDFWDVTDYEVDGVKGLTDAEAKTIHDFIEKHIGKNFYIHCTAGKSRSQAIVRYILDTYEPYLDAELNKDNPCLYYNIHVLRLLRKCDL